MKRQPRKGKPAGAQPAESQPEAFQATIPGHPKVSVAKVLQSLNERANAGEDGALAELRDFLRDHPELTEELGDLARISQFRLVEKIAGPNIALREALGAYCKRMLRELVGDRPSAVAKAAADRVICCSLELQLIDAQFGISTNADVSRKRESLKKSVSQRLDRALKSLGIVLQHLPVRRSRTRPDIRSLGSRRDAV